MFFFGGGKSTAARSSRQIIRNNPSWTGTKKHHRQPVVVVSATVLSVMGAALLLCLMGIAWLLLNALQPTTVEVLRPPPPPLPRPQPVLRPNNKGNNAPAAAAATQQQKQRRIIPNNKEMADDDDIPMDTDQVGTERPTTIDAFRETFVARFGPRASQLLREKAVQSFGSVQATANRFLQAAEEGRPFRMAFGGYSVTVGRGNFYHQSYPFVLYHLLSPLLRHYLDLPLTVKNAAIGGIPSFPYGFCLDHFLGGGGQEEEEEEAPNDVVTWDYSMNEQQGKNTAVLEAYVRHAQAANPRTRPLMLALDKHKGRCDLLRDYAAKGLLHDALCVAKASEILPPSLWSAQQQEGEQEEEAADGQSTLPRGLQQWKEFGAPAKCPGRGSWHPKKMEHAAIAWSMAMYFVDALELAVEQHHGGAGAQQIKGDGGSRWPAVVFPPPLSSDLPDNPPAIQSLLYGHAVVGDASGSQGALAEYRMHRVSCRTNFLPAQDRQNLLSSVVVSGLVPEATADSILETRPDEWYAKGWVLDVSQLERDTKIKVDKCGGLGYVDIKMALYGTAESGPLELWLPVDETGHEMHNHHEELLEDQIDSTTPALHWIESLVVCEANERRPDAACRLTQDLEFTVGGVAVASPIPGLHGAGEYLKRPTCAALAIPEEARLTKKDGAWGLSLRVQASSRVTRKGGACCLSHLVWEHTWHDE